MHEKLLLLQTEVTDIRSQTKQVHTSVLSVLEELKKQNDQKERPKNGEQETPDSVNLPPAASTLDELNTLLQHPGLVSNAKGRM